MLTGQRIIHNLRGGQRTARPTFRVRRFAVGWVGRRCHVGDGRDEVSREGAGNGTRGPSFAAATAGRGRAPGRKGGRWRDGMFETSRDGSAAAGSGALEI